MTRAHLALAIVLASAGAFAQGVPHGGGGAKAINTASTITSTVASGSKSFVQVTGAQLDLGGGTNDYLKSDGTGIVTPTSIEAQSGFYATSGGSYHIGGSSVLLDLGSFKLGLTGYATDGATAVGITLNNSISLLNANAKLVSIQSAGAELAFFGSGGDLTVPSVTTGFMFSPTSTTLTLRSQQADGSTAVGTLIQNTPSLTTAGAKLVSFKNNSTEKAFIDKDGAISAAGIALTDTTRGGQTSFSASTTKTVTVVSGCRPICTNNTATNVIKCAVATTTLTATETGSTSDTFTYLCL